MPHPNTLHTTRTYKCNVNVKTGCAHRYRYREITILNIEIAC